MSKVALPHISTEKVLENAVSDTIDNSIHPMGNFSVDYYLGYMEMMGFDMWQNVSRKNWGPLFQLHSHYLVNDLSNVCW